MRRNIHRYNSRFDNFEMKIKSDDSEGFEVTDKLQNDKKKLDEIKIFLRQQNSTYFEEKPQLIRLFSEQLKKNEIPFVQNNTAVYQKWMNQFDEFQSESKAENKTVNFNDFFDKMYGEWEKEKQDYAEDMEQE